MCLCLSESSMGHHILDLVCGFHQFFLPLEKLNGWHMRDILKGWQSLPWVKESTYTLSKWISMFAPNKKIITENDAGCSVLQNEEWKEYV